MAQGEAGIQAMILEGGPVETAFTVYSDFENYAGGELQIVLYWWLELATIVWPCDAVSMRQAQTN